MAILHLHASKKMLLLRRKTKTPRLPPTYSQALHQRIKAKTIKNALYSDKLGKILNLQRVKLARATENQRKYHRKNRTLRHGSNRVAK